MANHRGENMPDGGTTRLFCRDAEPAELLIRGAHVLDPRTGLDEPHDVLIRDGHVAELGSPGSLTPPKVRCKSVGLGSLCRT